MPSRKLEHHPDRKAFGRSVFVSRLFAAAVFVVARAAAADPYYPIPDQARVLFIGNSLFGANQGGVPAYSNEALKQMGYAGMVHRMVGNWGESLEWGLVNLSKYNNILASGTLQGSSYNPAAQFASTRDAILGGLDGNPATVGDNWHYVVLQDYLRDAESDNVIDPAEPDGVRGRSFKAIVELKRAADQAGAQVVLYMRWANNPETTSQAYYQSSLDLIRRNYDTIAAHLGGLTVVPVALIAHRLTFVNPPDTSVLPDSYDRYNYLYSGDAIHQSSYAKGMFAYAVATMLARTSPVGRPFEYGDYAGVPGSIDAAHQQAVWDVISEREGWGGGSAMLQIVPTVSSIEVPEGGTASFTVQLNTAPPGSVTVAVARQSGDPDITVLTPSITFMPANWNIPQTVSLAAAEDADSASANAVFALSSSGMATRTVQAVERDNDLPTGTGLVWAEQGGVVVVEAENYHSLRSTDSEWTLQIPGADENTALGGARGNYMALLPDGGYVVNNRSLAGSALLLDRDATVDYKVHIATPGTYRLHVRATGPDGAGDSLYAGILELRDGDGGVNGGNPEASEDTLADWYMYVVPSSGTFGWVSSARYESDATTGVPTTSAEWEIAQPGVYTVRFTWRENGVALDALVLQLSSLPAPSGVGPPSSAEYVPADPPDPYGDWAQAHGLAPGSMLDESPAGDGIANLMKYALGIDPWASGYQGHLAPAMVELGGAEYLALDYTRPEPAPGGVSYSVEASADLGGWSPDGTVQVGTANNGDGTATVTVRDGTGTPPATKRFIRLKVTQTP